MQLFSFFFFIDYLTFIDLFLPLKSFFSFYQAIVEFVDGSGNVLVAGSREAADLIRELVTEVGVEMDEEGAAVIDHLHYDANDDGQV